MADNPEVIRHQMEETRSNLQEKLEALEDQVTDTVQATTEAMTETVEAVKETVENVTSTVQETVENVTSTVQETVETVEETFNLRVQTERHPWIIFGGSVALGCLAAQWLNQTSGARRRAASRRTAGFTPQEFSTGDRFQTETPSRPSEPTQSAEGGKKGWFWEELNRVKGLALGSLMAVVRDLASRSLPGTLGQRVAEEVDHVTTSLGGETIRGPIVPDQK